MAGSSKSSYPAHNPTGKGLKGKIDIQDKDKQLAKDIMSFNLLLFNKYNDKAKSPEELAERFSDYFLLCNEYGRIPTVEGLAMVSGYAIRSFFDISQGVFKSDFTPIVQKAKDYIALFDSQMAQSGKIPAPVYIFRAKNYTGLKDTQDIQVTPNVSQQVPENVEEIIDKLPDRTDSASDVNRE